MSGRLRELGRAVAGPVACAVVLTGVLSAWVAVGGAGTLSRIQIKITLAAVPMRAFTARTAASVGAAHTYLVIRNLSSSPDELIAVRSPIAHHVIFTRHGAETSDFTIPGGGTLSLNPFADDIVLRDPAPFEDRQRVPLTLVFRHAGQITIEAPVTAPGTP